jgi:hypothetical protein
VEFFIVVFCEVFQKHFGKSESLYARFSFRVFHKGLLFHQKLKSLKSFN